MSSCLNRVPIALRNNASLRIAHSSLRTQSNLKVVRTYATELPRPPPTPPPEVERITGTARPTRLTRELPKPARAWPVVLGVVTAGLLGWFSFLTVVTNKEKMTSSVVNQIMRTIKGHEELEEVLGKPIRMEPAWYLNGDPRIHGNINQLQGNVDVSFRLKGSKSAGTVYFTSVRKEKGAPFSILRFRIIADDGRIVNILPSHEV